MKVNLICIILLLFVTSVGCTTKPEVTSTKPKEPHPDLVAMQGLWKEDYYEKNGEIFKARADREEYYIFAQDTYTYYWVVDGVLHEPFKHKGSAKSKFIIEPDKTPKRFTESFTDITGDRVNTNIYKFENDHLVIFFDPFNKEYPEDFITEKGEVRTVVYLRRIGSYEEEKAWYKIKRPWEKEAQKANPK